MEIRRQRLWYCQPAQEWNEALPLGNGRMGAMVFGGICNERLQVNEESVWSGGPMERNNPDAKKYLPEIRRLIMEGKVQEAERLCRRALCGVPESMRGYQTLGDIFLDFHLEEGNYCDYERSLDLESAVEQVSFRQGNTVYEREYFMSQPHQVLAMRFTAEGEQQLRLDVRMGRHHLYDYAGKASDSSIVMGGNTGKHGIGFAMMCRVGRTDGRVSVIGDTLVIEAATEIVLYWTAATDYRKRREGMLQEEMSRVLQKAVDDGYEKCRKEHEKEYQSYYRRMMLRLDYSRKPDMPVDFRLDAVKKGKPDVGLEELYFHYGRYLLISCSRPETLPANLQGIWNTDIEAPWDCKYTININTEMNYWLAEPGNLSQCHLPLFDHLKRMLPRGKKTAKEMYGCRGFVAHHNTDLWGDTAPQELWVPGSFWVMGGAWLCTHIWMHYEYTLDKTFLEEMFPVLREAVLFFLDFCVDYKGYACTCPSVSPENTFILPDGEQGSNYVGCTMDNQILRDLFDAYLEAAEVLSEDIIIEAKLMRERLMPTKIGEDGRILEWCEEFSEAEPGHRHISHLYGLYPSCQITVDGTPELAKAAEKTLEERLRHGGGHTGWSRAWIVNHYARLWQGDKAYENLRCLLMQSTLPNLFDNHPPFQIDGNFGAAAAMLEMLVQSDGKRIVLLPALPEAWERGMVQGICLRGGITINMEWREWKVFQIELQAKRDCEIRILYQADQSVGAEETVLVINGTCYVEKREALKSGLWYKLGFTGKSI